MFKLEIPDQTNSGINIRAKIPFHKNPSIYGGNKKNASPMGFS